MINSLDIKEDFPIFKENKSLVYLDNAATTQKPLSVIDSVNNFYKKYNSNINRGIYDLSENATKLYIDARQEISRFINASFEEIIFTKNATEAINLISYSWARDNIKTGDNIVLSILEHHSNIVPWLILSKEIDVELRFVDIDDNGVIKIDEFNRLIDKNTKLVSITHVSNVLGTVNDIEKIIEIAHSKGVKVLVDACQIISHIPVDVKKLDVDFLVFSGHKAFGPMGIGVLFGKKAILDSMSPFLGGGDMISDVSLTDFKCANLPNKFEAGTQNVEGVIGLSEAIKYINSIGFSWIKKHDSEMLGYILDSMNSLGFVEILGKQDINNRSSVVSFLVKGVHPHDIASFLSTKGICIRAGKHCCHPLFTRMKIEASSRISPHIYNTKEEIDFFIDSLNGLYNYYN